MTPIVRTYALLGGVLVASGLATVLLPVADVVRGMFAVPGVLALLGMLFQVLRDSVAFERTRQLQLDEQIFALGASSHMSTIAFDKHVQFCESYMSEVHETVGTLFREGPTAEGMGCAQKLFALKREYAAWIPKSVALRLEPFENAIHKIGVASHLVAQLRGNRDDTRTTALNDAYQLFSDVMGLDRITESDAELKKEIAVENVKEEVRSILGINELFEIRSFIIGRSVEFTRRCA